MKKRKHQLTNEQPKLLAQINSFQESMEETLNGSKFQLYQTGLSLFSFDLVKTSE